MKYLKYFILEVFKPTLVVANHKCWKFFNKFFVVFHILRMPPDIPNSHNNTLGAE